MTYSQLLNQFAGLKLLKPATWSDYVTSAVFNHIKRHAEANKHICWFDGTNENDIIHLFLRVHENIVALLEHNEKGIAYQIEQIRSLNIASSSESINYSTTTNNKENYDGYNPLPNVQGQSFNKQKYADYEVYAIWKSIEERNFKQVYEYLRRCIIPTYFLEPEENLPQKLIQAYKEIVKND